MTTPNESDLEKLLDKMLGQNYVGTDEGTLFTSEIAAQILANYIPKPKRLVENNQDKPCFVTDHVLSWAGEGYFCLNCDMGFLSAASVVKAIGEDEVTYKGAYQYKTTPQQHSRNELRQEIRKDLGL